MARLAAVAAALLSVAPFASADPIVEERGAVTQTIAFVQPSQTCVSGIHMIIARASLEDQGEGILGDVASAVQSMVPNSDAVAVVYPATEVNYPTSEQEGVVGMKTLVTDYVQNCPGHWISLLGYSQGAQVVADTCIGSNNSHFSDDSTNPIGLGKQYLAALSSIVMMGDPGFVPGTPGSMGTSTQSGFFPRQNTQAWTQYGLNNKIADYCDTGDSVCAGGEGNNGIAIHVGYVNKYGKAAASFIASKFSSITSASGNAQATGGSGGSGGSSSQPAATSAQMTSAAAQTSAAAAGGSSQAQGASSPATNGSAVAGGNLAYLTSQRYTPTTSLFTGSFTQLGNPVKTGAAEANAVNKGVAGAVFGGAMFAMGMM